MTGTSNSQKTLVKWAPLAVVLTAWLLRISLMVGRGGAWGYNVDYDEGVYFTAASLVWKGLFPFRDFVFVHPPGILAWLLIPAGLGQLALGPAVAFAVARWLATLAAAASVYLVYRLAERRGGPVAGFAAGLALALYAETVVVDRGVFLEPVLNLCCLALARALDLAEQHPERRSRWLAWAGAAAGAAISVKLWAGLWVLAALGVVARSAGLRGVVRFGISAAAVAGLVVLPALLAAPAAFFEQVVTFHTQRPPDGETDRLSRLWQIFSWRHAGTDLLAAVGLLGIAVRPAWRRSGAFFAAVFLGTVAAFFANTSYWDQYNSHLATSSAVLAGLGASWLWSLVAERPVGLKVLAAGSLAALSAFSIVGTRRTFSRTQDFVQVGKTLGTEVAEPESICSFEPGWLLAANRLPTRVGTNPLLVDTYAFELLEVERTGKKFPNATQAFDDAASQAGISRAIAACDVVVMGWRGRFQLAGPLEQEVLGQWKRLGAAEPPNIDAWRRPKE